MTLIKAAQRRNIKANKSPLHSGNTIWLGEPYISSAYGGIEREREREAEKEGRRAVKPERATVREIERGGECVRENER